MDESSERYYIIAIIKGVLTILFFIFSIIYSSKIEEDTSSGNPFEFEDESDKKTILNIIYLFLSR